MEQMSYEHAWLILAALLGIAEVLTTSFWALPFALGAVVTALLAWLGLPLEGQLVVFAIASLLALFLIQKLLRRSALAHGGDLRTNADALLGRDALVLEDIGGGPNAGAVKIGSERWRATCAEGISIPSGSTVVITHVGGASVEVAPK